MHDQLVPVGIAKLRHPADRRLDFLHIESNTAFFQFRDRRVDIVHLKSDRGPIA